MTADVTQVCAFTTAIDRSTFSCGRPELDQWLKEQARQQERKRNTRTFLGVTAAGLVGYYSTTTYRLELDEAATAFGIGKRRYPVPAVLLARLAVDRRWQGRDYGQQLTVHALIEIAAAGRSIGFEVVVVHVIDDEAVGFYARSGFTQFADHSRRLFITTRDLRATIRAEPG